MEIDNVSNGHCQGSLFGLCGGSYNDFLLLGAPRDECGFEVNTITRCEFVVK